MPSLRHLHFFCLLAGSVSRLFVVGGILLPNRAAAQINAPSGAIHPLDVKTGFWELTLSSRVISQVPAELLANLSPDQRAKIIDQYKTAGAKETVQKSTFCLKTEDLETGNVLNINGASGPKEVTSSSQKLMVHITSEQVDQTSQFERVDPENFRGSIQMIGKAPSSVTLLRNVVAKWVRPNCVPDKEQAQQLQQQGQQQRLARGIAVGANRDVLSFLPYIPQGAGGGSAEGRLGRFFVYFWNGPNPRIPSIGYRGGIPGAPRSQIPDIYFHGTDGEFLYVTIPVSGGLCSSDALSYKIDKAGAPTRLANIPKGLQGGKDQISGGTPCK